MFNVSLIFLNEFQKVCWYQLSQTHLERKISLKIIKFNKISTAKISVFKVIALIKKTDYFSKPCFQILVFDKQEVKWFQERKKEKESFKKKTLRA